MHINFCAISYNRTQDLHFSKNFGKIVITTFPRKLCPQKLYLCHVLKYVHCMQNFVRLHAIESEIELSQKFWGKQNSSSLYWAIRTYFESLLYIMIYTLYINFCAISSTINIVKLIPKIPEKVSLQRQILSDCHQKLIQINLCLDNTKHKILWNSVD